MALNCCVCVVAARAAVLGEMLTTIIATTVTLSVVVCVRLPEVPVTVTVAVPVVADLPALNVTMLALVAGLGLNNAVTPLGKVDVTARVAPPVKPFVGFTVIALVLLLP